MGWSFIDGKSQTDGFVKNEKEVAENLVFTLEEFFRAFPQFIKNPFYLAGESYR